MAYLIVTENFKYLECDMIVKNVKGLYTEGEIKKAQKFINDFEKKMALSSANVKKRMESEKTKAFWKQREEDDKKLAESMQELGMA